MMSECLYPPCEKEEWTHGLCRSCFMAAQALILKKETTWAKLEQAGKAKQRVVKQLEPNPRREWFLGGKHD